MFHNFRELFSIYGSLITMLCVVLWTGDCNTALGPPDVDSSTLCKSVSLPQRLEVETRATTLLEIDCFRNCTNWPDGVTIIKSSVSWPLTSKPSDWSYHFISFKLFGSTTTIKQFLWQIVHNWHQIFFSQHVLTLSIILVTQRSDVCCCLTATDDGSWCQTTTTGREVVSLNV